MEVQAVDEQQYLPKVPVRAVPIQHMASFYHSVAEPARDVLNLPIRGYNPQSDDSGENG